MLFYLIYFTTKHIVLSTLNDIIIDNIFKKNLKITGHKKMTGNYCYTVIIFTFKSTSVFCISSQKSFSEIK